MPLRSRGTPMSSSADWRNIGLRGAVVTVRGWHDGRLRVEYLNDQTMIVDASPAVREAQPREGDQVLVQDDWKVALEVVERRVPSRPISSTRSLLR